MNALFSNIDYLKTLQQIIPAATIVVTFLLFVILPQRYHKQQQQQLFKKLRPGTCVKTLHGISGTIYSCAGNFIILELDDGRKIEILRQTIAAVAYDKT